MKIILKLFLKILGIIRVLRTVLYIKTEFYINTLPGGDVLRKLSVKNIFSQSDTIIDWKRSLKVCLIQPPHAESRLNYSTLLRSVSSQVFNFSKDAVSKVGKSQCGSQCIVLWQLLKIWYLLPVKEEWDKTCYLVLFPPCGTWHDTIPVAHVALKATCLKVMFIVSLTLNKSEEWIPYHGLPFSKRKKQHFCISCLYLLLISTLPTSILKTLFISSFFI